MRSAYLFLLFLVIQSCTGSQQLLLPGKVHETNLREGDFNIQLTSPIENIRWELEQINEQALSDDIRKPYVKIQPELNRLQGFAGCNQFNGQLEIAGDSLYIGRIISTKKACLQLELENRFLTMLREKNWRFSTANKLLFLENAHDRLIFRESE
ncbi:META domain-containing protein [Gaoshiqia sp. Z1-71]|uniref:META domain-containing protein n=1 Tax=Gaoshiqia hydrogeniformans TaxID=3290090 RepID=UPI003BF7DDD1